jgi:hypothetical protein
MMYSRGLITGIVGTVVVFAIAIAAWSIAAPGPPEAKKATAPPAKVDKPLKEEDLHRITLTPEAVQRLALKTALVERKPMRRQRVYGGEVMVPIGQAIVVSAPISGLLKAPAEKAPLPGQTVTAGQPIFQLLPLLTPEGRANLAASKTDAEGLVNSARTQQAAAEIALARAERVYRSEAGSRRAVDEAQAQVDLANKALEAAIARRDLLSRVVGEVESGTTAPLPIESPRAGLLRSVSALPGQNVPAGAALFEVVDLTRIWVRVPVYVGDLPRIDTTAEAGVGELSSQLASRRAPFGQRRRGDGGPVLRASKRVAGAQPRPARFCQPALERRSRKPDRAVVGRRDRHLRRHLGL